MRLFPFRQPTLGLCIGAKTLTLAQATPGRSQPALRRCVERALPSGLLTLSASEPNVTDVSGLAKECSTLLADQKITLRPVPVALTLPDRCARTALLEFDALPQKPSEADALVRWQFHKDTDMPGANLRFTYQTFRPSPVRGTGDGQIRILAVGMIENVIDAYERACELAGLIPVRVRLAGLQLFNLCRPAIESAIHTAGECFYVYVGGGSFAFLAVRADGPMFVRIKPLRNGSANGNGAPLDGVVTDELQATLQFYLEQAGDSGKTRAAARTLFLIAEEPIVPALPESLGVTVVTTGWDVVRMVRRPSTDLPFTGLPAVAGLMEA